MLTRKDVALLNAALRFFAEEMSPFDPRLLRHYFDRPADAHLRQREVERLRALLKECELRYLACNHAGTLAADARLARSAQAAIARAKSRGGRPATVLLFREA